MASDLIERLRCLPSFADCSEAANILEAKDREIERLRSALSNCETDYIHKRDVAIPAAHAAGRAAGREEAAKVADEYIHHWGNICLDYDRQTAAEEISDAIRALPVAGECPVNREDGQRQSGSITR